MLVNQASTAVSNTLPVVGGARGVALTCSRYRSWGFSVDSIALSVLVTGLWNNFVKIGMPLAALALLALHGQVPSARITAAVFGNGPLTGAIALLVLVLRSQSLAAVQTRGRTTPGLGTAAGAQRVAAGGLEARVVAAVLIFRTLTYLLPIPFGALAYLAWRRTAAGRVPRRGLGADRGVAGPVSAPGAGASPAEANSR